MTRSNRVKRRGAIAPLTAILLIPILAMVAFAVDLGYITHTHNQLQAATDAAALAGASQMPEAFVKYHLPGVSNSNKDAILLNAKKKAKEAAIKYASLNGAGDVSSLALLDSDIEFGFTDEAGSYSAVPTYKGFPNTVKVKLVRDDTANKPLPLFFAKALGFGTAKLNATATASIYAGSLNGFQKSSFATRILPMTLDVNDWQNFLKTGKSPDGSKDVSSSGEPQLKVYPTVKGKGNFGELSLDQGNNGASTIKDWIHNGITGDTLQSNYTAGLLPLSTHNPLGPPTYTTAIPDWKGNPGMKTSTIQAVGDHVGELYLLPLFKPYVSQGSKYEAGQGAGSNYYYTVVEFVGVKITEVDSTGNDKAIKVMPSALIDPNALYSSMKPAAPPPANSSALVTTYVGAKLVQ